MLSFGLSDRYTWLEEDFPRPDGAPRRPLAYDDALRAKPARGALALGPSIAPYRTPLWTAPSR